MDLPTKNAKKIQNLIYKMFQNAYKNNPKYLKITPSVFAFSYRSSFSVWSIINEGCVCFFSGLVKGRYIATNMYKQRNTLVWNNYHAKLFIPSMHQGILAQLICFWNFCGMKPLKLFLGYILIFVRRRFHCFHSSIWSHKWCALTSA